MGEGPDRGVGFTPKEALGVAGMIWFTAALPGLERLRVSVIVCPTLTTAGDAVIVAASAERPTVMGPVVAGAA